MTPLIDADILRYEIGSMAEYGWDTIPPFSTVEDMLLRRVDEICRSAGGTKPPVFFLTGKGNFRYALATVKPYKGNRKNVTKPYHFNNLTMYLRDVLGAIVVDGMEADDMLCVHQTLRLDQLDTVICTRDKDLRQCPGYHYGWEVGKQPEFRLRLVQGIGEIELAAKNKSIKGFGSKFFYAQLLTGDTVDNIPGCPKVGPVAAYNTLQHLSTDREMYEACLTLYEAKYEALGYDMLREQAYLLWMVRELEEDGTPIMWKEPE